MILKREKDIAEIETLFKKSINNQDYDYALIYIKLYSTLTNVDVDIYINILNKILGLNTFFMDKKDNILGNKDIPSNIIINFNLAIEKFNQSDYSSALRHISICKKLISIKGLNIDLSIIESLLKYICIEDYKMQKTSQIREFYLALESEDNVGYCYFILHRLKALIEDNVDIILLLIESCLQLGDYDQVECLLNYINDYDESLCSRINYYRSEVIRFRKKHHNFQDYVQYELQIEGFFARRDIAGAEDLCNRKLIESNNNTYLYKFGKLLYTYGFYEQAKEVFKRYLFTNDLYSKSVYFYLYFIALKENDLDSLNELLKILFDLTRYEDSSINISIFKEIVDSYKDNFTDKAVYNIEKDIFCNAIPKREKQYIFDNKVT